MQNRPYKLTEASLFVARAVGRWALLLLGIIQAVVLLLLAYYPGSTHGPRFPTWLVLPILFLVVCCGTAGFWARRAFSGKLALCVSLPLFIGSWAVLSERTMPGSLETGNWVLPSSVEAALPVFVSSDGDTKG